MNTPEKKGIWINGQDFRAISQKTSPGQSAQPREIATRQRAGESYGFGMYLPNPDKILRNLGLEISAYRELLVDPHIGACIVSRKSGVKSLNWSIDRDKAPNEATKLIDSAFKNLDIERITGEILDAPFFGYRALEVIWENRNGTIVPVDVIGKPPEWFTFDTDNKLRFRSITSILGEELPPMKFLLASHEADYQNPYGFALLSRCFWPFTFKKGGWKFFVKFVEKFGSAFAVGKHPRGAPSEEIDALADMLDAMIQSAIAVIPDDSSVDLKEAAGKSGTTDLHERLITLSNSEISKAILGQTLTTEVGDTGSYAASNTHFQVRGDIVDSDKKMVCSVYNTLVNWTHQINFGQGERPVFSLWSEKDVDLPLSQRDKNLTDTRQVVFKKSYFMRAYGLKEDEFEVVKPAENPGPVPPVQFSENPLIAAFSEVFNKLQIGKRKSAAPAIAEGSSQEPLDILMQNLPPEILQKQAEQVLKPVLDLLNNGADFKTAMQKMVELYPTMNTDALVETLHRLMFLTELWGRMHSTKKA